MTSRDFCYWLQGFFEIRGALDVPHGGLTHQQVEMIQRHLALVFKHEIDPSMGPLDHQAILNKIHAATEKPRPEPPYAGPGEINSNTLIRC